MNDPLTGLSPRYPEKSLILGQVFNDTAASYKFFWLLGILNLLQRKGGCTFKQRDVIKEMIVGAWHPVCFYRLSLGAQDNLQHTVKDLMAEVGMKNDATAEQIHAQLNGKEIIREHLRDLGNLVPTRFLSPWFAGELRGVDGHLRTRRIQELAVESQRSSCSSPYFLESIGGEAIIHINESWAAFFRENFEVIRSFVFFHLCRYLQARNPNVPGIVNKLNAPVQRELESARRFWGAVRSNFHQSGKAHLFQDIYSGNILEGSFSIDHFLPWSFVAHDLLWNLAPVSPVTNSKKGDALPRADLYLPKLSQLHREALLAVRDRPRMLEDYANWFMADVPGIASMPEEQFFQRYRESIEPQLQIAQNQGFQANWVLL